MAENDTDKSQLSPTRVRKSKTARRNVVSMPLAEASVVADFLRYHVLIRVFNGDADQWLAELESKADADDFSGDIRFARWIRGRLRRNPGLMAEIRRMVDATPFWRAQA